MLTDDCIKIQPLPIHPHNFQMIRVHRLIHQMRFNSEINRPRNQDDENQERPVLKLARALEGASRLPPFEGGIVKSTLCTVLFSNHRVPEIWAITASWQNGMSGNQQVITINKATTNSFPVDAVDCNHLELSHTELSRRFEGVEIPILAVPPSFEGERYGVSSQIVIRYIYNNKSTVFIFPKGHLLHIPAGFCQFCNWSNWSWNL